MKLEIPDGPRALYLRIADAVRIAIRDGQLVAGETLPSTRDLAEQWGFHRHTIRTALGELVSEGWLTVEERAGYRIHSLLHEGIKRPARRAQAHAFPFKWTKNPQLSSFAPGEKPILHNFQSGLPDLRMFPLEEFKSCVNQAMRTDDLDLLNYSTPGGWHRLAKMLEQYLEERRGLTGRKIIITNGSQEAIYLTLQLLITDGDWVALENLTYPPARESVLSMGARIAPIKMDEEGIIPQELEKAASRHPLKALFLTPTHQFPTTSNISAARRLAIYEIARSHRIPIIEDDYDHEFHYVANPPPPLASLDRAGLIIYVSTFSKLLFPSGRLAFMAVPQNFYERFCQFRRIVTHQNDSIMQEALACWLENGGMYKHLRKMKSEYERRRDTLDASLKALAARGSKISWRIPEGGMALWLNIHRDAQSFAEDAKNQQIFISPESDYQVKAGPASHLRLGFSNLNPDELQKGVAALGKLLK